MPPETIDWFQNLSADRSHSHRQLDELCRRFGQSWRESRPPRIDAFISAAAADARRPLLLRLLPLDLEARWHYARTAETVDRSADDSNAQDELPLRPRLEDYVHRFSTILRLEELPADLIAHEYRVRHRWGDRPDHAEYVSRFSAQSDSIVASLNQVDAELADKGQAAKSPLAATLPQGSSHGDSGQKHPVVAGYEILSVLGRGGMGVVYRARQVRLNRMVALKMILSGSLASPEEINRFRSEAEAAAKLDHAGIVPIFEVGGDGDQHYFSMAYIEGKNLADQLARGPLAPRDAAEMVERIAAAVEYAHQHGIIHRDLKPRNILLTVDGLPKITDFGLAKNLEADQGQTASGQILGTPGYMSPEQAQGKISATGKHSDVYSLGAILYCLLTGRPPFQAQGAIETLRQVVECEPVSPRLLNAAVTRDLETICLRCLAKDPAQRLASAQALADELGRTLRGEPIRSRRIGPVARVWRWARRKPLAAALCLAVVVLCVSLWAAGHFAGRANRGQQLTAALGEFEMALDGLTLAGEPLTNLDAMATRIEALSPQRAAQARSRLSQSYASVIEQALAAPKLADAELSEIETAIGLLERRDPGRSQGLRAALDDRRSQWQSVFDLQPPFAKAREVFDVATVADGQKLSWRPGGAAEEEQLPPRRLLTSVACQGDVALEATFAETWQSASEIGLVLNGAGDGGYSFVLRLSPQARLHDSEEMAAAAPQTFADARDTAGFISEEIWRNGVALVRRTRATSDLPEGPLRVSARRQRDELSLQINSLPPLKFFDPFTLAGGGFFGLRWPSAVHLASLRALNRSQPRRRSGLQDADVAYDEGRFSDALALYQKQLVTGADGDVRQEARYKSALCLAVLNRGEEASDAFEVLSGESGDRWPPLAGCQLWVARLRQQRGNDAEAIFENLSGRFSVEQLAALAPADVRDEIMRSYGSEFYSLSSVLRFTAKRVEHAERALAIGKLLNADSADNLKLAWNLMCGYEARGDIDRALELAASLARQNPSYAYAQRRYVRLLCLAGKTREALDVVEGILRQAPTELLGFRQTMLLERSRVNATMGALEDAETDVDMLLSQPLAEDIEREYLTSYAYLLQGSLRDRRGDTAGAQNAWREGLTRLRQLAARSGLATAGWLCLQILGSLTGDLTDDDAEQCFEHMLADAAAAPLVRVALPLIGRQAYIKTFRQMWRSSRGRALADDFAFDRLTIRQRYQLPLELAGAEFVRLEAFGGEWSPRQEDLVNQTAHDLYLAIVERGALRKAQLAQLALGWKGIRGALGWSAAAPALEPDLRARLAYVFAHRYLKLGQQADAEALFREASTALPDSPAAKLARADLDLLAAGHGLLVIESGAPRAVDVSIGPQGAEAAPLSIDRDGQASLSPGKYRLTFAESQDDLTIAPDEIELTVAAQRVARIRDRWRPAPAGQSLPGLAPRPSVFPGLGRWQVETRQARGVTVAARSPDGRQLAVAGLDGRIRLYATDTMSLAGILAGHELAVSALAYQPGGTHLATGSSDGSVRIWRMPGGQIERVLRGHTSTVNCVTWSSDGGLLASGGDWHDPTVRLWQANGERLATVDAGSDVRSVAVHPDGRWLAAAIFSKDVRLWHADGKAGPTLVGHSGIVESVAFSPDGQWLASGAADQTVRLWQTTRWATAAEIGAADAGITAIAWSGDGKSFAVGTWSGNMSVYATRDRVPLWQRKVNGPARSINWSLDNTELTTFTTWARASSWQAADGQAGALAEWRAPQATAVTCSMDGRLFAVADFETISMSDIAGQVARVIKTPATGWLAFDSRHEHLASLSWEGNLQVWRVTDGSPAWKCPETAGPQRACAFSADGQQIAAVGDDRVVRVWAVTGELIGELAAQDDAVLALAFSPDGHTLAVGLGDKQKQARLWQLRPPRAGPVLSGHLGGISTIAWSADGSRLATAGHDNAIRLWHSDGRPGPVMDPKRGWQASVAFSPDGQWLAAFGFDSRCRLWHVDGTAGPVIDRSIATNSSVAFNKETGNLLVLGRDSTVRTFRPTDGEWLSTTVLLPLGRNMTIGSSGQLQALSPGAADDLLYYVETPERGYRMLSPSEFQQAIRHSP